MPAIFLIILSLIDIFTGVLIYQHSFGLFPAIFYYSAYFHLIKGGFSWMGSIGQKNLFEWMGTIDMLGGFAALMISFNFLSSIFPVIGILLAIKGLYSLAMSFF